MVVKIKNIKIVENNIKKSKHFVKLIEDIKLVEKNYEKFIPNATHTVSFVLHNTEVEFANFIRRSLIDEIPVLSMTTPDEKIITNDDFIINEHLSKQIELIPFKQEVKDDLEISLKVINKTDDIITIYSGDIEIKNGNNILKTKDYMDTGIPLINLRSSKKLEIKNIELCTGIGKNDNGRHEFLNNITYEILDVEPLEETKEGRKGQSSLNSNPTEFAISYTTFGNIEPKLVIKKFYDIMSTRLISIQNEMKKIKETDKTYISDLIELQTIGNIKEFHFIGEYWTVARLISKFVFIEFNEIEFVASKIKHPSIEIGIVAISHPNSCKLIINAIFNILKNMDAFKKAF